MIRFVIFLLCFSFYLFGDILEKKIDESELKDYFFKNHKIQLSNQNNLRLYKEVYYWLGTPQKDFGNDKTGIDCSSLTKNIMNPTYSLNLSGPSFSIFEQTKPINIEKLKEGDLVFFKIRNTSKIDHVGIYLNDSKFIHTSTKKGVTINSLNEDYYKKYFVSGGRLPFND